MGETNLLHDLSDALGPSRIVSGSAVDAKYLGDWMVRMSSGTPAALVTPQTTAEVSAILKACNARSVPVVPQGGRTGLAGGATPIDRGVILTLEHLAGIDEIDDAAGTMTARAGTPLQTIQHAAEDAGLFFPLDLGARGSCQIGGNVATNAGGNRVIRYGMTRDLVLGLEAVLADGTVLTSLNKLVKNNAGLDTRQVFVGSEGILGIVTRVVLRLHPQPRSQAVAFCAVEQYERVPDLLRHARATVGATLSAFEVMWPDFYGLVTAAADAPRPLPAGAGGYVLIEALGANEGDDRRHFDEMLSTALETGLVEDGVVAGSAAEAREFWRVRDGSGEFPRLLGPNVAFDIGLPIRTIGRFVDACAAALRAKWPDARTAFFGHIGDSNLHVNVNVRPGEQPEDDIDALVYGLVREWGGTVSSEHGIGLLKRPYLGYTRTAAELDVMRRLKGALDPKNILNPGKVL